MADTTFVSKSAPAIPATWLQDLNNFFYRGAPASVVTASTKMVTPAVTTTTLNTAGGNSLIINVNSFGPQTDLGFNLGSPAARFAGLFSPLIDSGTTGPVSLKTNSGETIATFNRNGATANQWDFFAAPTGNAVFVRPSGTDPNIPIQWRTKGTGNHSFTTDGALTNVIQFQILHTANATNFLTATGSNGGNPTLAASGGSPAISYPAAGGTGTPTSNILAMYEEGTWTPSLGGTTTYTTQSGKYVKVGKLVFISGLLTINAIGTGSTSIISGLPFTSSSGSNGSSISICNTNGLATAIVWIDGQIGISATTIALSSKTAASTNDGVNAIFTAGSVLNFSGVYSSAT